MVPPMNIVGKRYPRDDAPQGVSGGSKYVDDLNPPGVLYGAVLRAQSQYAEHAPWRYVSC